MNQIDMLQGAVRAANAQYQALASLETRERRQ